MRKTARPIRSLVIASLVLATNCGGLRPAATSPTNDQLAGRYSLSGGGGALQIVTPLTEAFSKAHPGVIFVVEDTGSDAGVELTQKGSVDLGMTSRDPKESEKALPVQWLAIGYSGTGVAVNAGNPINGLAKQQVKDIFSGVVTNWSAVGGSPGTIFALVRESGAATRSSFESYFFGGKAAYGKEVVEVYEIEETIKSIRSFRDSIGMLTVNQRTLSEPGIKLLAIDGVMPSQQTLANGQYPVRRPLYLVYNPEKMKPAIAAFLDFVKSSDGQRIIAAN